MNNDTTIHDVYAAYDRASERAGEESQQFSTLSQDDVRVRGIMETARLAKNEPDILAECIAKLDALAFA